MSKIGPREAQLRALKEAHYEERQQRRQPAKPLPRPGTVRNASPAVSPSPNRQVSPNKPTASPNADVRPSPNKAYARNLRWRIKNRDRYNATMRDLMRRLRAERRKAPA